MTSFVGVLLFILPNVITSLEVRHLLLTKYSGSGYLALYGGLTIPFGEDQFLGWFCKILNSKSTAVLLFLAVYSPPVNYLNEISCFVFVYEMQMWQLGQMTYCLSRSRSVLSS